MYTRPGAALLLGLLASVAAAADPFDSTTAQAFLKSHCLACHSGDKPKGDQRLDQLAADFTDPLSRETWAALLAKVRAGEMPPKERPRPKPAEIDAFANWTDSQLAATHDAFRAQQGRTVLRRLNRYEYENTIRDLLKIDIEVKDLLPEDTSADGFDNSGAALHTSSFLMERYLEAADAALTVAIANGPQPPTKTVRYSYKDEHQIKHDAGQIFRSIDDAVVFFSSTYSPTVLGKFYTQTRGLYRFRISAYAFQSPDKPVTFRVQAGGMMMGQKNHLVGYFDAPPGEPTVYEFVEKIEPTYTIQIVPHGTTNEHGVRREGAANYAGPGLAIQWVEVEGPLHVSWPPPSHRLLFADLPQQKMQNGKLEVVSTSPHEDAPRLLLSFATRAFRRDVTAEEIRPFVELFESRLADGYSFEESMRVAYKGILVAPDFLFLRERPGKLDDFALASRLSYFLWSTMPDDVLLALAREGKLSDKQVLHDQVERMLQSPKSKAFTQNFLGQWLKLRDLDFTNPDHRLYPEYDEMLRASMEQETHAFFEELLREDLSVTNIVDCDFAMLNERLARHYGIPGVEGHAIRKVTLPPDSHRGGMLTMASVLKVTANGTVTSPVVRGAFVLDRILGQPPPPPPDGVPAVEPDIRGTTTIREQLAKHREIESCAACHAKIDPPGFALENYDVIGGWRDHYRSVGNGQPVMIDGQRMPYLQGKAVDAADVLSDGRTFQNIDELKRHLASEPDVLSRSMASRLVSFATGAAPTAPDQPEIEKIVAAHREKKYGLRSLIHLIVASDFFQNK